MVIYDGNGEINKTLTDFIPCSCIICVHEICYELYIGQLNEILIKKVQQICNWFIDSVLRHFLV